MDSSRQEEQDVGSRFSFLFGFKIQNLKKTCFSDWNMRKVFVNASSILDLHPNQAHQYIR